MLVWELWKINKSLNKTAEKPVWKRVKETEYGKCRYVSLKSDSVLDDKCYDNILDIVLEEIYQSEPVDLKELALKIACIIFRERKSVMAKEIDNGVEIIIVSKVITVKK